MNKIFLLILFLSFCSSCKQIKNKEETLALENIHKENKAKVNYYVNAKNGLNVRSKPNKNSSRLTKLKYNSKVGIIEDTNIELSIYDEGRKIIGKWVKIENENQTINGYVFSGFLVSEKNIKHYVINTFGAKVFENPNFNSKIINNLKLGKKIFVDFSIESYEKYKISKNYSLDGKWIKPIGINGYIFSSEITNKKVELNQNKYGTMNFNLLGKQKSKAFEKEILNDNSYIEYSEILFENGKQTYTFGDGCQGMETTYNNLSENEAYHIVMHEYGLLSEFKELTWKPFYDDEEKTVIFNFHFEATVLHLALYNDGKVIISDSSCD